jgi:hypothetical protein
VCILLVTQLHHVVHPTRYFDARGRGEAIRVAFADRGLELAERSFTASEWGRDRPDGLKAQM